VPNEPAIARPALPAWLEHRFAGRCIHRVIELQPFDLGFALAARAFVALIPVTILAAAVSPAARSGGFADALVVRFGLEGEGAKAVRALFATPDEVTSSTTVVSVILALVSVFSFARAMARMYARAWHLPPAGVRGMIRALVWVGGVAAWIGILAPLRDGLRHAVGAGPSFTVTLASATLVWLWTPYLLLAGRVAWQRLMPAAIVTGTALTVFAAISAVYMPRSISSSAEQYGLVGVAFALVSWLIGAGVTLVVCSGVGAVASEWLDERAARSDARAGP
jgi:membrane protein